MSVYDEMSETQQFACRVIADHARSTAFAIADGILPGNEGRNYVLRKIMRRAIYHGREHLSLTEPFFYKVCDFVVDNMHGAFPELETQREFIGKMVRLEEERFGNTVTVGLTRFEEELERFFGRSDALRELIWSGPWVEDAKSVSDRIEQFKREYDESFPYTPDYNLASIVLRHRVPTYFVKSALKDLPREKLEPTNDQLRLHIKFLQSDSEEHHQQFDQWYARTLLNYLDRGGSEEERKFVAQFILGYIGNLVPENYFREILLNAEQSDLFLTKLDLYLEGDEKTPLPNFRDFAKNYDTFGTPRDLIKISLEERGYYFTEGEFDERFDFALRDIQSRSAIGHTQRKSEVSPVYAKVLETVGGNEFRGYETTHVDDATIVAILDGEKQIDELSESNQGSVVLDQTPFYAESGGQVGDVGKLTTADALAKVADTYSPIAGLIIHKVTVEKGSIKVGDTVTATVDVEKRDATRRNHTATHLVHAALKEVLGSHVKQAGSVVAPSYLRFDFTHYQPMSASEIAEIEDLVNRYILRNEPVTTNIMALEDAMRSGAVAMFGEKYGSKVRVLSVGDGAFSRELCGGTHVRATGDIGSFKITSDEAIASGVRRIRAITGFDSFERFREDERLIDASLGALNTQRDNLPNAIARLAEELKKTRKEMDELKLKIATGSIGAASSNGDEARDISGVKVLAKQVDGLDANGTRQLSDTLLARLKSGVVVLGRANEGKVSIIVRVSDDLTDKVKAGNIIKEIVPIVGGRGGGKADMAEGGGTELDKLSDAIEASYGVIETMLK